MLERTKSSGSDGQLAHDTFQLRFDLGDLPDGNNKLLCGLSFLANTAGISFSLPADGPISKAEVTVTGGAGFANGLSSDDQLVLFADYTQLKQETGSDGGFRVDVLGKRQKHDLPDSARPVSKEYSLSISAQLAEVNAGNIASIFLDGLTVSDGVGVGSAVLDVAQTLHLASDDPVYPLTDWVAGYTVDQTTYGYHLSGTICDPAKPYHLQANGNLGGAHAAGTITVVPSGSGGTWTYDGSFGNPNAVPQHGTGRLKSEFPDKSEPDVTLLTGDWYVVVPIAGTTPLGPSGHHLPDLHLDLHPIEGECPQNS